MVTPYYLAPNLPQQTLELTYDQNVEGSYLEPYRGHVREYANNNFINSNDRSVNRNGFHNLTRVLNANETWGANHQEATTALWATEKAYDYFNNIHGRNGTKNNGFIPNILTNVPQNAFSPNFYGPGYYHDIFGTAGDGQLIMIQSWTGESLATLDIIGHEYAHGVTRFTSNLVYEREPGALNESFSDIMGYCLERRTLPNDWNWLCGEDIAPGRQLRNMQNPADVPFNDARGQIPQPSTYLTDPLWHDAVGDPDDAFGVHINSGVMNRWFYLLCSGGNQNGRAVNAIAFDRAERLLYLAFTSYMTSQDDFADARTATLQAAQQLYGNCSAEYRQVGEAWAAVGVGTGSGCAVNCSFAISANANPSAALINATTTLSSACTGTGCTGVNYTWTGNGVNQIGQSINIAAPGSAGNYTYTVSATQPGCTTKTASAALTVSTGTIQACAVNKVRLWFRAPGDCCMDRLNGATIQGSTNAGTTWTTLSTISQNGTGGWQEFTFTNTVYYSSVRFVAGSTGWGELGELEFYSGTTKMTGTPFGSAGNNSADNFDKAFDGNTGTMWHGPTVGSVNNAGLSAVGCATTPPTCDFNITASSTITNNQRQLNYNCIGTNCSGVTYAWSGNGVSGSTSPLNITAPTTAGTYTYTVTASKSGCTNKTATVQIVVGSTDNTFTCSGVTFTEGQIIGNAGPGNAVVRIMSGCPMVYWEGGSSSGRTSIDWLAYLTGKTISDAILTSCLKWDGQSCTTTPTTCDFNISASTTTTTNGQRQLNYSCTGNNCSGVTYAWSGNGVSGSTSPLNFTAPAAAGTYTYTVTASKSGCNNKTATVQITIAAGNTFTCSGVTFTEGQIIGNAGPGNAVVRIISGCPMVYWEGGSSSGRTNHDWLIYLTGKTISDAILTSCLKWEGQSCSLRIGVEEKDNVQIKLNELVVSPNPNTGVFEVSFYLQKNKKATLSVIDVRGTSRFEQSIIGKGVHTEKVNLEKHPSGTYLVQLRKDDGVEIKRLIVIK
ncbi:M4 family metallopeptidase [Dyadobacter sp. NIV53]|uniref:M4 family metallopeptidase n=1 Tax=Dyadobacter sp. NIV53 TaxID=2861765 RepID=UPI001C882C0D|nr:M4 family metallopeptidase [Dyadobacter sp. NIV53]